ncbi:MAG: peptidoglycan recognition family protein [Armatimonadota bacterium]|nr:peptidoglycan recognition family protein [Armatimonadota bacterium]
MRLLRAVGIVVLFILLGCGIAWYLYRAGYPLPPPVARFVPPPRPLPEGILIHHSATPFRLKGRIVDAKKIDEMHQKRGFSVVCDGKTYHIGYHYVILPDGRVEPGRPEDCPGAHAGNSYYNRRYLGVCLVGDFDSHGRWNGRRSTKQPTRAQIEALVQLCARLMHKYNIPLEKVRRHRDVSQTYCPGDQFPYQRVKRLIAQELQQRIQNASLRYLVR